MFFEGGHFDLRAWFSFPSVFQRLPWLSNHLCSWLFCYFDQGVNFFFLHLTCFKKSFRFQGYFPLAKYNLEVTRFNNLSLVNLWQDLETPVSFLFPRCDGWSIRHHRSLLATPLVQIRIPKVGIIHLFWSEIVWAHACLDRIPLSMSSWLMWWTRAYLSR